MNLLRASELDLLNAGDARSVSKMKLRNQASGISVVGQFESDSAPASITRPQPWANDDRSGDQSNDKAGLKIT